MTRSAKESSVHLLDRFSLRLSPALLNEIDTARGQRAGSVSRNTWITEAVQEKLRREVDDKSENERQKTHG